MQFDERMKIDHRQHSGDCDAPACDCLHVRPNAGIKPTREAGSA